MKNKNLNNITGILVLLLLGTPLAIAQTETIPWIPLSKDAPDNIPGRINTIITIDKIGIPLYPGAYLTSYYPPSSSDKSDASVSSLATIFLVSTDNEENVKKFYIENLKKSDGWNLFEEYVVFVKGDLNDALSRTVPGVAIREETGESYDLQGADPNIVSSLKTRIKILYNP
ncbi:MAG: hypothetical protein MUF28_06220 [Ignavibacterium sp.]|jgi:hypothetical protein|nr:hypothetical protein [Ignavibacterium sp.]